MTTTQTTSQSPLYKDMTDSDLRSAYWGLRQSAYNWSQMAPSCNPRSRTGRKVAAGFGRNMRHIEIIEAIARKRHISLRIGG